MPSASNLGGFAGFAFILVIIPGPSVLFVIGRGVALGRRAAVETVAGNTLGAVLQVFAVAAGLAPLMERSDGFRSAIRWLGAGYLVYLGVQAIRHRSDASLPPETTVNGSTQPADRHHVRQGFVVGITNPKLMVFLAAVLPQFVDSERAALPQILVLGLVFAIVAFVSDSAWGILAGTARTWLGGSADRVSTLGLAGGVLMIGVGVAIAVH